MAVCLACLLGAGCGIDDRGLGPAQDAAVTGPAICAAGLIDKANWPAGFSPTSCNEPCGPDLLGARTCAQTDLATCGASSGCVCLASPCVRCADCAFLPLPDCYVPINAGAAAACAASVSDGSPCGTACDRRLCLEADGKTGCVCNAHGRYACATWGGTSWK